ncbi:MAG: GNAT family N-acetyltransferase [Ruminococcaceae bacterium]|nr:GNAT family N-acetyltransferase [Oscillospiraceae bacterium]
MDHAYYARMEDINELHCFYSDHVRWLNPETDFDLIKEYFSYFDIHNDTDTYFGINLKDIKTDYSINEYNAGHLCGVIVDGKVLSLAGVAFGSQKEWEICAVSTHPDYMGNGFSKAVCSFIAKYIIEHNHAAICQTHPSNFAMQAIMRQIGMKQYYPQSDCKKTTEKDNPTSIPPWDEIVSYMYDKELSGFSDRIVKVMYSKDGSRRIIVLKSERGFYITTVEIIRVFDEDEWQYFCKDDNAYPAWWETDWKFKTKSFYDSPENALKGLLDDPEIKALFE